MSEYLKDRTEDKIQSCIEEAAQTMGCVLWGTEFVANGRSSLLRIFIDKADGSEVEIDDCVNVSRQLDLILEVKEPTPREYTLEMSSPGLDRKFFTLEQMGSYTGKSVRVSLLTPLNSKRKLRGVIKAVDVANDSFALELDKEVIEVPFSLVRTARLQIDF